MSAVTETKLLKEMKELNLKPIALLYSLNKHVLTVAEIHFKVSKFVYVSVY